MAAQPDARLQDLQRMNAAAKESVNIFDKLFARARLSEKDQAKLQNGQRQLYQELADQERKLSMNSPGPKPLASPAPSVARPSISDFGSPIAVPSAVSTLRKEPPAGAAKGAPKTPTIEVNVRAPAAKGTPKASLLKPPAAGAGRRASEMRRESERFGASSPLAQTSRPKEKEKERDRDREREAPATPKKPRETEHAAAPSTPSAKASAAQPSTPSSRLSLAPPTPTSRAGGVVPGTPSSRLSLAPAPATPSSRASFDPSAVTQARTIAAEERAAHTLPVKPAGPPQAAAREDPAAAESRAFNSATITQLEAENRRLQQALRNAEAKYERLRVRHEELLTHSLDMEEQLVNSEADKVSIIATCLRILKDAGVQHEHPAQLAHEAPAEGAPPQAAQPPPPTPQKQLDGVNDSGWLEDGDVQESLAALGADVTVPERTQ